jgi:hypothetical protein
MLEHRFFNKLLRLMYSNARVRQIVSKILFSQCRRAKPILPGRCRRAVDCSRRCPQCSCGYKIPLEIIAETNDPAAAQRRRRHRRITEIVPTKKE